MVNSIFIAGNNTYNGKSILGYDVIRLPELYYIIAEANITKDPAKAKEYFDKVLKSRGRETLEESFSKRGNASSTVRDSPGSI